MMIFVNLVVADVVKSRAFYEALGFDIKEQFSNEDAACVVLSESIYIMILARPFFQTFTNQPIGEPDKSISAIYALGCADRAAVDSMMAVALAAGGSEPMPARDLGFMYNRMFADLDGHVFEPFWMDPAAVNGG
jgi:predicted lactoylglutathione lyase